MEDHTMDQDQQFEHEQVVVDLRRKIRVMLDEQKIGRGNASAAQQQLREILDVLAGRKRSRSIQTALGSAVRQFNRLQPADRDEVLKQVEETFPLIAYR